MAFCARQKKLFSKSLWPFAFKSLRLNESLQLDHITEGRLEIAFIKLQNYETGKTDGLPPRQIARENSMRRLADVARKDYNGRGNEKRGIPLPRTSARAPYFHGSVTQPQ